MTTIRGFVNSPNTSEEQAVKLPSFVRWKSTANRDGDNGPRGGCRARASQVLEGAPSLVNGDNGDTNESTL